MRKVVTFLTLFNVESTPTQEESTIFTKGALLDSHRLPW